MNAEAMKTYPVSIPSIALALMAANLACHRAYGGTCTAKVWLSRGDDVVCPSSRHGCGAAGQEFYRIIDRISRGEKP